MKKLLLIFIVYSSISFAQEYEYLKSFGNFKDASSFYITANGMIYVSDSGNDEIFLLDTLGNMLESFGGYGWDDNSFDFPADVFADPLSIYIADKNNHAIKRFDKNLNYVSSLYKRDSDINSEQFGYPLSCATSNQGDLYLIDSENERVLKFDIFGNFKINFGGFDAGQYQLSKPFKLAVSSSNKIFVIDGKDIVVFDAFGNGINILNIGKELKSIRILFDQLVVTAENEIYQTNLKSEISEIKKLDLNSLKRIEKIVSAMVLNNSLYVLTPKELIIYKKQD